MIFLKTTFSINP